MFKYFFRGHPFRTNTTFTQKKIIPGGEEKYPEKTS
jgi:hypothetical protein